MIPVSTNFKEAARGGARVRWYAVQVKQGKLYTADDLLSAMKLEANASWLATGMVKLTFSLLSVSEDLLEKTVEPVYKLKTSQDGWEAISYGHFTVKEQKFNIEAKRTDYVAYDNMYKFYLPYNPKMHVYPCKLYEFLDQICDACGVQNGMSEPSYHNAKLEIPIDYYAKINNITYRDILKQIAETTARTCLISRDGKLYLKTLGAPMETITNSEMRKLKIEPIYGAINTLNLSRQPQNDDIVFGIGSPAYMPPWTADYTGYGDDFKYTSLNYKGYGVPKTAYFNGDLT